MTVVLFHRKYSTAISSGITRLLLLFVSFHFCPKYICIYKKNFELQIFIWPRFADLLLFLALDFLFYFSFVFVSVVAWIFFFFLLLFQPISSFGRSTPFDLDSVSPVANDFFLPFEFWPFFVLFSFHFYFFHFFQFYFFFVCKYIFLLFCFHFISLNISKEIVFYFFILFIFFFYFVQSYCF